MRIYRCDGKARDGQTKTNWHRVMEFGVTWVPDAAASQNQHTRDDKLNSTALPGVNVSVHSGHAEIVWTLQWYSIAGYERLQ